MRRLTFTRSEWVLVCLVLALFAVAPATVHAAPLFFLSTDRTFAPGDEVQVKLEAKGLSEVEMRVYRLEDPLEYLLSLPDVHRPAAVVTRQRVNALDIVRFGQHQTMGGIKRMLRRMSNPEGRHRARTRLGEPLNLLDQGETYLKPPQGRVAPLQEHPLVARWDLPLVGSDAGTANQGFEEDNGNGGQGNRE